MSKLTQKAADYINFFSYSPEERAKTKQMLIKAANRLARKHGFPRATSIDIRFDYKDKVVEKSRWAYCKNSTGEVVSKAYLKKGWRNCHYRSSVFKVQISVKDLWLKI